MLKNKSLFSHWRDLFLAAFIVVFSGCGPVAYITTARQIACQTLEDHNRALNPVDLEVIDELLYDQSRCIILLPETTVYRHSGDPIYGKGEDTSKFWLVQVELGSGPNPDGFKVIFRKDFLRPLH